MIRAVVGVAILAVLARATPAAAHPMDIGYLRVDVAGSAAQIELDLDVNLVALLLRSDPHALDDHAVAAHLAELAAATYLAAPMSRDGVACTWAGPRGALHGRTVSLADRADCGATIKTVHWAIPFAARAPSTFKLLVKVHTPRGEQASIVERDHPVIEIAGDDTSSVSFADFVRTGFAHIGAAPSEWHTARGFQLPDGIDHILFVLALLLAGGSMRQLAGVATGFTLGHTVTLALSTLDVVRPPAALIEPLIALSIAIVAAEALSGKLPKYRWRVATCFGLIHGFGFARALQDFDLSKVNTVEALFGFNVGVEIGQLTIIAIAFPLLVLARRYRPSSLLVTRVAPGLILVAGLWWFIERLVLALRA